MSAVVSVLGLTKKIGKKQVLKGISFQLEAGRVIGILGPNGAGKTTLLKTLMNIYQVDGGEIQICDRPVGFETKKYISYMPDMNHLFPWMRVRDAIHYYNDMWDDFDMERAAELCKSLGIDESIAIKNLSKGNKERVLIMLTFSRKAKLYLLDEPLDGIDPLTRNKVIRTIFSGINEESTILISTHLVKDVETLLDQVLFIHEGRLVLSDSADNIREVRGQSIEECYLEVFENA